MVGHTPINSLPHRPTSVPFDVASSARQAQTRLLTSVAIASAMDLAIGRALLEKSLAASPLGSALASLNVDVICMSSALCY